MSGEYAIFIDEPDLGAKLRLVIRPPGPHIHPKAAGMLADAIDIADSTARSDIECHFLRSADGWYNLALIPDESFSDWLPQIEHYLTARGMIERHPENANLVRFVKRA